MNENNTCERCGHKWTQRKDGRPVTCPVCKSPKWDIPRRMLSDGDYGGADDGMGHIVSDADPGL